MTTASELADELATVAARTADIGGPNPDYLLVRFTRNNLPTILSALRRVEKPCPACADKRRQIAEEADALWNLRERGIELSDTQNAKADAAEHARQALTGEA